MIALFGVSSRVSVEPFDGLQLNSLKWSWFICNECLQSARFNSCPKTAWLLTLKVSCTGHPGWPSGSNFLLPLSPQILGPILSVVADWFKAQNCQVL